MISFLIGFISGSLSLIIIALIHKLIKPDEYKQEIKDIKENVGFILKHIIAIYNADGSNEKPYLSINDAIEAASKYQESDENIKYNIFVK